MAAQTEGTPAAQIVGNAFVQQYYIILHQSPEQVHKFYQDSSVLDRPGPDGVMTSVTTMQGINEKILSMDFKNYKVEILTADAQSSYKGGLIVLVTGYLTGTDNLRRKFSQTFFLAPQDNGYFVLNDVFRYVDEYGTVGELANSDVGSATAPLAASDPVVENGVSDHPVLEDQHPSLVEDNNSEKDAGNTLENGRISENGKVSTTEDRAIGENPADSSQNENPTITSNIQEDTPKKSFASVVTALKGNAAPFHVRVSPAKPVEQPRVVQQQQQQQQQQPPPEVPADSDNTVEKNNDPPAAAKAYAIFVPNLPMTATVEELAQLFEKFGSIKTDGIQVRSNKQQGSCFGFVEFESITSMQEALKASPIIFVGRKLFIEERRANNDRGRLPSARPGFRNDGYRSENYRGRGNFGGRGQGKNEFRKWGDFQNRGRGNFERNGEGFQRGSYQNGGGRVDRQEVKVA